MAAYIAFIPFVGFNADVIDQYMCSYPQTDLVAAFGQQGKAIGKPPGACVKESSYRGIGTVGTVAKGDIFLQGMNNAAVNQEAFQVQAGAAGDTPLQVAKNALCCFGKAKIFLKIYPCSRCTTAAIHPDSSIMLQCKIPPRD